MDSWDTPKNRAWCRSIGVTTRQIFDQGLVAAAAAGVSDDEADVFAAAYLDSYVQRLFDERSRCAAIILSAEAEGREDYARHLALKTDLSAAEAIGILAALPITRSFGFGNFNGRGGPGAD